MLASSSDEEGPSQKKATLASSDEEDEPQEKKAKLDSGEFILNY